MIARDVMTRDVITTTPSARLGEVVDLFTRHHIGSLPVTDPEGRLVGIVTEADLLRTCLPRCVYFLDSAIYPETDRRFDEIIRSLVGTQVEEIMSRPVVVAEAGDGLGKIVARMLEKRVKHLPILEAGRIVGIISSADIVRTLGQSLRARKG